jgi:hypothetical protein
MVNFCEKFGSDLPNPCFKLEIEEVVNKTKKQIHPFKARDRSNTLNIKNTVFSYKPNEEKQINIPKNNPLASMGKHFNKFDLYNK